MDFDKEIIISFPINTQKKLINLAINLIDEKLKEINTGIEEKDKKKIHHALHTIIGLNSIGANKISIFCKELIEKLEDLSLTVLKEKYHSLEVYSYIFKKKIKKYHDNIHIFNSA